MAEEKTKQDKLQQVKEIHSGAAPAARGASRDVSRSSLMQVGRRVDYAIRALSYLAAQPRDRVVRKTEIERLQDIPPHYLSKIMRDLVSSGFVTAHCGPKGGFRLARAADGISIKEVYESIEGPLMLMRCLDHQGRVSCRYDSVCTQISVWERVQFLLADFLAGICIRDVVDGQGLRRRIGGGQNWSFSGGETGSAQPSGAVR